MSALEIIAVLISVLGVTLTIKRHCLLGGEFYCLFAVCLFVL